MSLHSVPELLREGAELFEQRNALYGDNYKTYGAVMVAMFPEGLPDLVTVNDHNRFGLFVQLVAKLTRYGANLSSGGHVDSARDMKVYAAMLEELTEEGLAAIRHRRKGSAAGGAPAPSLRVGDGRLDLRTGLDGRSGALREEGGPP